MSPSFVKKYSGERVPDRAYVDYARSGSRPAHLVELVQYRGESLSCIPASFSKRDNGGKGTMCRERCPPGYDPRGKAVAIRVNSSEMIGGSGQTRA